MYADVVDVLATDAAGRKYGRRRCDDGAMYLGDFADDCLTREGWGMLVSLNGDTYHGEFRDGKPNGYGEMRYASGASHRGLWERGERNGSGVFVDVDGGYRGPAGRGIYRRRRNKYLTRDHLRGRRVDVVHEEVDGPWSSLPPRPRPNSRGACPARTPRASRRPRRGWLLLRRVRQQEFRVEVALEHLGITQRISTLRAVSLPIKSDDVVARLCSRRFTERGSSTPLAKTSRGTSGCLAFSFEANASRCGNASSSNIFAPSVMPMASKTCNAWAPASAWADRYSTTKSV